MSGTTTSPAQPTLATSSSAASRATSAIQGTKQGLIFTLDRDTGQPVFPVEERPVPQGGVPGEVLSPTQPFPADLPALVPIEMRPEDAFGLTPWDRGACRKRSPARATRASTRRRRRRGRSLYPFTGGGVNWGGLAFDAGTPVVFVNTSQRAARWSRLFPRDKFEATRKAEPGKEISPQSGAPFGMKREVLLSPLGLPCNPPPWGTLAALDLRTGKMLWETPLGTTET